jgi:anti-sigma regulatory factor (Ser/Thr protein kinase)
VRGHYHATGVLRPFLLRLSQLSRTPGAVNRAGPPPLKWPGVTSGAGGASIHLTGRAVTRPRTRRTYLELAPNPAAVRQARQHAAHVLERWQLAALADDASTVTSELVTNAVTATAALPFCAQVGLLLAAGQADLAVLVWDASPHPPVPRPCDGDALSGRGLEIVAALTARWGFVPGPRGKVVWALLTSASR